MTFDLIVQLLLCPFPGQMLHVTINHLELLKNIAASTEINILIGESSYVYILGIRRKYYNQVRSNRV